jgi:hypothetical protein
MRLNHYLTFNGQCEAAFKFYESIDSAYPGWLTARKLPDPFVPGGVLTLRPSFVVTVELGFTPGRDRPDAPLQSRNQKETKRCDS